MSVNLKEIVSKKIIIPENEIEFNFFKDPLMKEKNTLLYELETILSKNNIDDRIIDEYSKKLLSFKDKILNLEDKLLFCADRFDNNESDIHLYCYLIDLINEHRIWSKSIDNTTNRLNKINSFSSICSIPSDECIIRWNFDIQDFQNDFPNIKIFKKYNINDSFSINIVCKRDGIDFYDLDIIDIAILLTLYQFCDNNIFHVNSTYIHKYLSRNNVKNVSILQKEFIDKSIDKLLKLDILIEDKTLKKTYKEKLLYAYKSSNNWITIIKDPIITRLSIFSNSKLIRKKGVLSCPINMTKSALKIREYLISTVLCSNAKNGILYFNKAYKDLKIETPQEKKYMRDSTFKILNYWVNNGILCSYNTIKHETTYDYIEFIL